MLSIANTKDLENAITGILKPRGFRKKRSNWYYDSDDAICMVNLQKSDFGGSYYINLGALFVEIDKTADPVENKCHIRMRLDNLVSNRESFVKALNLEDQGIVAEDRVQIIASALEDVGVPFLMSIATVDGAKKVLQENRSVFNRTVKVLMEHLFPEWFLPGGKFHGK